jgi:hypothetical protein
MNQLHTEPINLRTGKNSFVQAAAILPVVTDQSGSQPCPRAKRAGMAGLLEDELCPDEND